MGGGKGGEHRKRIKKGVKETFWNNPILLPWIYMCTLNGCNVLWASLIAQLVKNLPAVWETWDRSLGWEDPLEKGKAAHSSILARRTPWTI